MQKVSLSNFDAVNGGKDLLTPKQASFFIAECGEEPAQAINDFEYTPYEWEHKPLFSSTDFSSVSSAVLAEYQQDHLYLVFNDDIGVLRDLASYQGLVAESLEEWQADEQRYQKYIEGSYIETQLRVSPEKVDALATMLGNENFINDLSSEQKESVVDWIQEYDDKFDDLSRTTVGEKYRIMEQTLGAEKVEKYRDLIHDIQEQFSNDLHGVPFWKFWNGSHGTLGIKSLINQDEMELFLEQERAKLAYWSERLNTISLDRVNLFDRFYAAAWYFDASTSVQLEEFLAAEYSCIQDLCWNDEASLLVEEKLEEMPWVATYRAMSTLSVDEYDKLTEAIAKKISEAKLIATYQEDLAKLNALGAELNSVINNQLHHNETIQSNESLNSFSRLIDSTYTPANTIGLTNTIDTFFEKMANYQSFSPSEVLRNYSGAAWLGLLQAYSNTDITLGFASQKEMSDFDKLRMDAAALREENTSLKNRMRQVWAEHRKKGRSGNADVSELVEQHKSNQATLAGVENKIHSAISPISDGAEKSGFYIKGLTEAQKTDVKQLASDYRAIKNVKAWSSLNAWDGLSALIVVLAVHNAVDSYSKQKISPAAAIRDTSAALSAVFGLAQGIRSSYDTAAYNKVSSAASKLTHAAALGRWTAVLGAAAYAFGYLASSLKAYQAANKFMEAIYTGNNASIIKHSADFFAESSMTLVNIYGAFRSAQVSVAAMSTSGAARAAIWANNSHRLISMGIRVNLIGLMVSAVQLGVTATYNYFSLSDYLRWFRESRWGSEPQHHSLQKSNQQLAQITSKPSVSIKKLASGNALSIIMLGITINELDDANIEIAVYWLVDHQKNDWQPWTEPAAQQWVCLSEPSEPLEMGLPIFPREANAQHGIGIELRYLPTPDSEEHSTVRYQTNSLNRTGLLNEVSLLKAKNTSDDNLRLLTTNQLK
ncbi:zinc ABC transporter permease [Vibrio paucivorans]|uniref:Zinc ABC transporter permease n=1 Tax=Vibrio paucivorans TaxID=2829489 RepID=A0A9X3HRS8_9VIBR|nr:zinc ABC transporter permease [Vibrio paucivorans]MCW8334213.1 zinc ABC transporter permease [Vibrio paucivorans]